MKEEIKNNTKKCYYCKKEIDKLNNICPYCNKNQTTHKIVVVSIFALAIALITFILIISKDAFVYKVSSIINVDNINYKVESVDRVDNSKWMGSLDKDSIFLVISMSVKNNNIENIVFDQTKWLLLENDNELESLKYSKDISSLSDDPIDNRKTVSRVLIYKIKKNSDKLMLKYYDKDNIETSFKVRLY